MREIATRIGRGNISSSTVHNMFCGPRVPQWNYLRLVVSELHGDTTEFQELWQAAADNSAASPPGPGSPPHAGQREGLPGAGRIQRKWSTAIPLRNLHFTGRTAALGVLRDNLARAREHPLVQVISGAGGTGKTEIAMEYIYRYAEEYEIIWWIDAGRQDRVEDALVDLAQQLELRQMSTGNGREWAVAAILETLASGATPSWLLVFDDAAQPRNMRRFLPTCIRGGHVIITSRLQNWPDYFEADSMEVPAFSEAEAVDFLRRRIPALAASGNLREDEETRRCAEATRLASALGHLPIAAEHAAAYLVETGESVDEYLARFGENARRLFTEQPADLPAEVSATREISTTLLTADAEHLFNLCAFFSPEPIAIELLQRSVDAITEPAGLREVLSSPHRFRAAATQLQRLSLARVDGARDLIQMHRVVQEATKVRLRRHQPETFGAYRAVADILLAESNPGHPDHGADDAGYEMSLPHLEADPSFFHTANPALRQLIIDQVRRLHLRGRHVQAMRFGQAALRVWSERLGPADLQVLTMSVEVAIAQRLDGEIDQASQLTVETLLMLRQNFGDEHEVSLLAANLHGADLRTRGAFREALVWDQDLWPKFEHVFGPDHERTLNVRNNLAADYRRLGRFQEALDHDRRTFEDRQRVLGVNDLRTLSSYDAIAFDLRGLGLYHESLDTARKVVAAFTAAGCPENLDWLNARKGFAVALRKAGHHAGALRESEEVVQRYHDYLGPDHTYTLRAATNLINDRRMTGELDRAEELGRDVQGRCQENRFPFEFGYAALVSLASVLRVTGQVEEARRCDLQAMEGLAAIYGDMHPFPLAASINYASDLAASGKLTEAIRLGRDTLARCRRVLGENHPDSLMAAANLAVDEAAAGNEAEAETLLGDAIRGYGETLSAEHPAARAAARRNRLTAEIEPY